MKPKVFNKKLNLNKKTIADLNGNEMKEVHGGELIEYTVTLQCCPSYNPPGVSEAPIACRCRPDPFA